MNRRELTALAAKAIASLGALRLLPDKGQTEEIRAQVGQTNEYELLPSEIRDSYSAARSVRLKGIEQRIVGPLANGRTYMSVEDAEDGELWLQTHKEKGRERPVRLSFRRGAQPYQTAETAGCAEIFIAFTLATATRLARDLTEIVRQLEGDNEQT